MAAPGTLSPARTSARPEALTTWLSLPQGVAPYEADGTLFPELQPELRECFAAIERYLDIDLPSPWAPADKARRVADAVVNGEWDGDAARYLAPEGADAPRLMANEELFMQMLETAVRR